MAAYTRQPTTRYSAIARQLAHAQLRNAPSVTVVVEFERSRPRVIVDAESAHDFVRLGFWLDAHPELHRLVSDAVHLEASE
jgi:hypothetical protein